MEQQKPYVITIVGPESSGKTTLARELAAHFSCPWVPEFARVYLESLGRPYDQGDLEIIAEGQLALLNRQLAVSSSQSPVGSHQLAVSRFQVTDGNPWLAGFTDVAAREDSEVPRLIFELEAYGDQDRPILIVDSGMLSLRMWARIKYGITIPMVEECLASDKTSMYILCRPVLPWEIDPLREAPSLLERAWIYNHYLNEVFASQVK